MNHKLWTCRRKSLCRRFGSLIPEPILTEQAGASLRDAVLAAKSSRICLTLASRCSKRGKISSTACFAEVSWSLWKYRSCHSQRDYHLSYARQKSTRQFLRFSECLLSEEQTGGVCMWGWRPCLFFFPWFMHHPQRSQRSFKYCLSSCTRLTFSSESVSDSVEGFKIRGRFMVIGSFVLISSASNNLSPKLKLVPGMQQAVLRLLLKKGKRKSVLFLKMNAFLSTLHHMLLQDIK